MVTCSLHYKSDGFRVGDHERLFLHATWEMDMVAKDEMTHPEAITNAQYFAVILDPLKVKIANIFLIDYKWLMALEMSMSVSLHARQRELYYYLAAKRAP